MHKNAQSNMEQNVIDNSKHSIHYVDTIAFEYHIDNTFSMVVIDVTNFIAYIIEVARKYHETAQCALAKSYKF